MLLQKLKMLQNGQIHFLFVATITIIFEAKSPMYNVL